MVRMARHGPQITLRKFLAARSYTQAGAATGTGYQQGTQEESYVQLCRPFALRIGATADMPRRQPPW